MATIAEIKSSLLQYVAQTDDEQILLKVQHQFISLLEKEKKIIAYTSKGKGLTIKEYQSSVNESIQQYREGKVISQAEMEKRIEEGNLD